MGSVLRFFSNSRRMTVKRPDNAVKLPGGRTLAVDAKAPLSAYLDAEEAPDHVTSRCRAGTPFSNSYGGT